LVLSLKELVLPSYILIIFNFMKTIVLLIFGVISMAKKYGMSLFPTIFALKNIGIYVSSLNNCNIASYIKVSVN